MVMDIGKIFTGSSTNIMELLVALADPANSIEEKRLVWNKWKTTYYNLDETIEFFSDTLFKDGDTNYLDIITHTNYKDFYELMMSLDLAAIDPKAYYLFWILGYGHNGYTKLVEDAFEYDPETILAIFPCFKEVILEG